MSNWIPPITHWGQGGQTSPGIDDFNRIEENIRIIGEYNRAPGYGVATGTNAKTITLDPAPTSYYDGLCFAFKNITENTGAVTINVNGLGAKAVKKPNGNDVAAGFLKAGSVYTVRYNGTNFILQGSDSSGNAMPEHVLAGKTFSGDIGTEVVGTMPNIGQQIIIPGQTSKAISLGYHDGTGYVQGSTNLKPENIKSGVNIFNVIGTLIPLYSANGIKDITSFYTTISGLSFRPKFITVHYTYWTGDYNNFFDSIYIHTSASVYNYTIYQYGTSNPRIVDTSPFTLYDDGFMFRLPSSYADTIIANNCQARWMAWG